MDVLSRLVFANSSEVEKLKLLTCDLEAALYTFKVQRLKSIKCKILKIIKKLENIVTKFETLF